MSQLIRYTVVATMTLATISAVPVHAAIPQQCLTFATDAQNIVSQIDKKATALSQKRSTNTYTYEQNFKTIQKKTSDKRAEYETYQKDIFKKLSNKLSTSADKKALTEYKTKSQAALVLYRQKIDTAQQLYYQQVTNLLTSNRSAADQALSTLKTQLATAANTAQDTCATKGMATAQQIFSDTVRNSQSVYIISSGVKTEPVAAQLTLYRDTYKATRAEATKTLQASLLEAKTTFKKSLKSQKYIF